MAMDYSELEEKRSNFFRDSYRKLLNVLIFLAWVGVALSIVLGVMIYAPKQPDYYASTTQGNVTPIHSLSEPVITSDYILKWASLVALGVLNLNFDKASTQLQAQRSKFTSGGWSALNSALKSSGFMAQITDNKLIASAVVDGAPVITLREIINGRFTWIVQLPLLINFTSASENSQEHLMVTMTVKRVPVLAAPAGIQVSAFAAVMQASGSK